MENLAIIITIIFGPCLALFLTKKIERKKWINASVDGSLISHKGKLYGVTYFGKDNRGCKMDDHNGKYKDLEYPVGEND